MSKHFNTVEDQPSVKLEEMKELAFNEVRLSDGRVVEMRESTGADEMIVSAELGDNFEANGGGFLIMRSCLVAKTITKIDGKPIQPMRGFGAYRDFAASFKAKDWNKIRALYDRLNGDDEGND